MSHKISPDRCLTQCEARYWVGHAMRAHPRRMMDAAPTRVDHSAIIDHVRLALRSRVIRWNEGVPRRSVASPGAFSLWLCALPGPGFQLNQGRHRRPACDRQDSDPSGQRKSLGAGGTGIEEDRAAAPIDRWTVTVTEDAHIGLFTIQPGLRL